MRTAVLVLFFATLLAGQPGSIDGTVVDQTSSKALAGVHVRLYIGAVPQMAKEAYGAITDADGHFSVAAMQPGTYTVELTRAGFFIPAAEIVVHRGEHIGGRQLAMLPLIPVSGRVVNQLGDPVPDTYVQALPPVTPEGRIVGPFGSTVTDQQGQYCLYLTPGKYYVMAGSAYRGPRFYVAAIRQDGTPEPAYAATYYPSALDAESASSVEAKAGGEVAGLEIRMRTTTARSNLTVSGTVTGIPAGGTAFVGYWWGDSPGKQETGGTVTVGADGHFSWAHLSTGYVRMLAQCSSSEGELQSDLVEIHLEAQEVSGLQLVLTPAGAVAGRVTIAGGDSPVVVGKLKVWLAPTESGFLLKQASSVVDRDGAFRIAGVTPGRFEVRVDGLPENGYIQSILLDGVSSDGNLDLSRGTRGSQLKIVIGLNGAQISGELHDSDGGPLLSQRAHVYLEPESGKAGPNQPFARIDGGHYVMNGVPPGKYRLFAADYSKVNPETRPVFLKAAETVDVLAGGRVVRNLKMLEAPNANPKQ